MSIKGDYLRVSKPITSDGINLIIKDDRVQYKETFLPVKAMKHIERKDAQKPPGLRSKLEIIKNEAPVKVKSKANEAK